MRRGIGGLWALVLALASLALAAGPEAAAVRILDTGRFDLPRVETRAEWHLADAKPPIADPVRLLRLELWFGVDYGRWADVRMTIVRERPVLGSATLGTLIAVVPLDHYANPTGPEVRVVVDLSPGVVLLPGDTLAILYSGEPVYPPQPPAGPTHAHFGIVGYWTKELP